MEERRLKIENKSRESKHEDFMTSVNNNINRLIENRGDGKIFNYVYYSVYDEKKQTLTFKEHGRHWLDIYNISDCRKINKKCDCNHVYSSNGYYIYCTECGLRQPKNDLLFPLHENIKQDFINYGIINNTTININNTLTKYDVMKKYPISMDLFKNTDYQELFIKILEHHDYDDIVKYFEKFNFRNYRYYKDNTIYNRDNELITENDLFKEFYSFWKKELLRIKEYFKECKDYPIIDNICYNKHIIFNMTVLNEFINTKRSDLIKCLLNVYDTKELTFIDYTNKHFIDKISYTQSKKSIIKYNDIYNKYIEWRSTRKSTDIQLSKESLKDNISEHLNTKYKEIIEKVREMEKIKQIKQIQKTGNIKDLKESTFLQYGEYRDSIHEKKYKYHGWRNVIYT